MKRRLSAAARGFTLVELMIVLVIIAVLAGVAVYNFAGAADKAKTEATKAKMAQIKVALSSYYGTYSAYPPSSGPGGGLALLLQEKILTQAAAKDAWNMDFQYYSPAGDKGFALISCGPDKEPQTPDDIVQYPDQ
ncbi:MAG: type II secretion system protein GspG [Planctomycetes bacterium]|nr:type II secretion system protein GspG [Planctomycetota bacterium]